uniref:F-box domain-containing protein n=1 Tax=Caenorhabditis tropicalis TaxID=1561998 RepID=A0A1I7UPB9_9PELO
MSSEAQKPLNLSKLPPRFMWSVVNRLKIDDKFRLRKVCRGLRRLVDRQFVRYRTLLVDVLESGAVLQFANHTFYYDKHGNTTVVRDGYRDTYFHRREVRDNARRQPVYDLASILMMEGLRLDHLIIDVKMEWTSMKSRNDLRVKEIDEFYYTMTSISKLIHNKISVKKLTMRASKEWHIETILPLCEPGTLVEIDLGYWNKRIPKRPNVTVVQPVAMLTVNNISEMDQWKQAKIMYLKRFKIAADNIIPFLHFNRFEAGFTRIKPEMYYYLKKAIQMNRDFISCHLTSRCRLLFALNECRVPGSDDKVLKITAKITNGSRRIYIFKSRNTFSAYLECLKFSGDDYWFISTTIGDVIGGDDYEKPRIFSKDENSREVLNSNEPFQLVNGNLLVGCTIEIHETFGVAEPILKRFDQKAFTDVVLIVGGYKFHVNKMYLASHSPYFESLFLRSFKESQQHEIDIFKLDAYDFQKFLEVLHGLPGITEDNVDGIVHLSDFFDAPAAFQQCEEFYMFKSRQKQKDKFHAAVRYKMDRLKNKCLSELKSAEEIDQLIPDDANQFEPQVWKELLRRCTALSRSG